MRIKLTKKRREEIKSLVIYVLKQYGKIKLPVPIKNIIKFLNIRLVPYSTFMKYTNLSYEETVKYFDTDDACTDYSSMTNMYVIYFNDVDKSKAENNRVRWSLAHELGHAILGHHSNEHTRLFRNNISDKDYYIYEEEADLFASYILVPNIILAYQNIKTTHDISKICKISETAARYRFIDFCIWLKKQKIESYDKEIFRLYNKSEVNQDKIYCLKCGTLTGYNEINYCYVCGYRKKVYKKVGNNLIYSGIELNENKRVIICPVCNNEQLKNDDIFCKICGFQLYNMCSNFLDHGCGNDSYLDGNARYCHVCGGTTTFFNCNVLSEWDKTKNEFNDEDFDNLPF